MTPVRSVNVANLSRICASGVCFQFWLNVMEWNNEWMSEWFMLKKWFSYVRIRRTIHSIIAKSLFFFYFSFLFGKRGQSVVQKNPSLTPRANFICRFHKNIKLSFKRNSRIFKGQQKSIEIWYFEEIMKNLLCFAVLLTS